ncbi:TolC family outer membrane protein [Gilvimarinus sp. SDUM040013]|uniref:TolC family outer membrane protein n=1 Tax=Gilvimarinus gilvus TaxID=3058038 RepID=A0ABU4S224_9GAMM|nr:TolC family outer membrane protein [Gilvimarinus sp. SDUM040013]MDO3384358.1 TolC family outer membrane protein [Gilvimarinus sp. SDUM040013]MDX6851206.1 TolC family outer membrane protein [Gilvimarinus sp. SDUM040013]
MSKYLLRPLRQARTIGAALTLISVTTVAQTQTSRDAVLGALESNPEVKSAMHTFEAADYEMRGAKGGYFPSLDISAGTGKARRDYDERDDYTTNRAEIALTQLLFDGFRVSGEVGRLDEARQVRYLELRDTLDGIALESFAVAEDLVRFRELLDLARTNYQEHLEVQAQIKERVDQGVGRRADLDQVEGRVALAESNLLTEASNLHDVTAKYLRLVGQLPPAELQPVSLLDEQVPDTVNQLLEMAYRGNPGFHAAIKNIASAQAGVKTQRSNYYPTVELRARYGTQQNLGVFDERFDPDDFGDEGSVELAFTYNLFNGGSDRAAVRQSLAEVDTAMSQRDQACVNLRQDTQIAYNDINQLTEQLVSLQAHRDASNRVRAAYAEQFQIGQRTLLDVLDAENEYFESSRALINANHDLNLAYARVLDASGQLIPTLNIVGEELPALESIDEDMAEISVEPASACPVVSPTAYGRTELISDVFNIEMDDMFDEQSTVLSANAMSRLDRLIAQFGKNGTVAEVLVSARMTSDKAGLNETIAQARVKAVRNYLVFNGLELASVVDSPIDSNSPVQPATDRVQITVRHLGG